MFYPEEEEKKLQSDADEKKETVENAPEEPPVEPTEGDAEQPDDEPESGDRPDDFVSEDYIEKDSTPSYSAPEEPRKPKKSGAGVPVSAFIVLLVCAIVFIGALGYGIIKIASRNLASLATSGDVVSTVEPTGSLPAAEEPTSSTPDSTAAPEHSYAGVEISPESTKTSDTTTTATNLIAKCFDSVVEITIYYDGTAYNAGSGVIYTADGNIITNYHVARYIESADASSPLKLVAKLTDGSEYEATYICGDMDTDIAVIKINKSDCPHATIGNSDTTVIGEEVWAIGNPGGDGQSFTYGHISAIGRDSNFGGSGNVTLSLTGLFLTDTAINGGNSGGGLFNAKGELIGIINGKKYTDSAGNAVEGMGYAIPIAKAIDCINTLVQNDGYIPGRAKLGVTVYTAGTSIRSGYSTVTYYTAVISVAENTAAANAGIKEGDIIIALGGVNLKTYAQQNNLYSDFDALHMLLLKYKAGDTTTVTVLRSEQVNGRQTYETVELEVEFIDFNYSK